MMDTSTNPMPAAHRLVLVVDDDQDLRDALRQLLEEEGYRVICAEHGQAALAHLRGGLTPDAILLDLWMPVMDGWQLRRELELDPALSRIPIVLLTATRLVNAIPAVCQARPGLLSALDLPLVTGRGLCSAQPAK